MSELDMFLAQARRDVTLGNLKAFRTRLTPDDKKQTLVELYERVKEQKFPRKRNGATRPLRNPAEDLDVRYREYIAKDAKRVRLQNIAPVTEAHEEFFPECAVCLDHFRADCLVYCASGVHALCLKCFDSYVKVNVVTAPLERVPCPECRGFYDPVVLQLYLDEHTLHALQKNSRERDEKVALHAGNVVATMYCECGHVGVVQQSDLGNGVIVCPCRRSYCTKCGNFAHPGTICPAPRETLKWVSKHAKRCPNCGQAIQKNKGCKHMTCRLPLGCGHEFCWTCLGPFPLCHCGR